ncbi:methyltransferase domain-containing protein [Serratia rubidaea]|uniref:class I SAM-dependent methyltransferase n=1 Tax=Serratia rubidaea TaxID=61652 RepID=UPI002DBC9FB0|nr:methyltransferase domain-containing protein [Serratia rubidaea]MEB7588357.1 methyltransferase domain-containing protein [Serratia rubidaea]
MKKSIYDDGNFFASYLKKQDDGATASMNSFAIQEQYELLPEMKGLSVLDLGCGTGDFLRYATRQGASNVVGLDSSARMIQEALRRSEGYTIEYIHADFEAPGEIGTFDLCFSSLALHYVNDITALLKRVNQLLRVNGVLLFSVEHPIASAQLARWHTDDQDNSYWGVEGYLAEGERKSRWFGQEAIKYHRPFSAWFNALESAGFRLTDISEPHPSPNTLSIRRQAGLASNRPAFIVFKAIKE